MDDRSSFLDRIEARKRHFEAASRQEAARETSAERKRRRAQEMIESEQATKRKNQNVVADLLRQEAKLFAPHLIPGTERFQQTVRFQPALLRVFGVKDVTEPIWVVRETVQTVPHSESFNRPAGSHKEYTGIGINNVGALCLVKGYENGLWDKSPLEDEVLVPLKRVPLSISEQYIESALTGWQNDLLQVIPTQTRTK